MRRYAADENLTYSSRATDFITPKSEISLLFRNTTLRLAKEHGFARSLVNSGRLSTPSTYEHSELNTPDTQPFAGSVGLGGPACDAPLLAAQQPVWWLGLLGQGFCLVLFDPTPAQLQQAQALRKHSLLQIYLIHSPEYSLAPSTTQFTVLTDHEGIWRQRYDAQAGSSYLFRPDQHLAARWRHWDHAQVTAALERACGHTQQETVC